MRQYYYTVSSFPALRFEEEPFLDISSFLELCAVEVSPEDLAYVASASIWMDTMPEGDVEAPAGDDSSVRYRWQRALRDVQLQAAQMRAQNLGREGERFAPVSGTDASLAERVRSILNEDTPLKMELALMRRLWNTAEELEPGHHFDRDTLFLYHVKLQIAIRRARITDSGEGGAEYDRQYEGVAESLMEIAQ